MSNPIDKYIQFETAIADAGLEISASEVHGTVVGSIANHLKSGNTPDLLKLIEPSAEPNDGRLSHLSEVLYECYRETTESLLEGGEGFDILLPTDDEPLELRVEALASWARGYLLGLLYNNAFSVDQLPETGPEIARDFIQIAEATSGIDEEKEEDWALAELHEYLKVGAQLIFEFIYSERASEAPQTEH